MRAVTEEEGGPKWMRCGDQGMEESERSVWEALGTGL